MNKSYRVLFNRARGCMMVVNELTSTVCGRASKTAVATAALVVASTAMAGTPTSTVNGVQLTEEQLTPFNPTGKGYRILNPVHFGIGSNPSNVDVTKPLTIDLTVNGKYGNEDRAFGLFVEGTDVEFKDAVDVSVLVTEPSSYQARAFSQLMQGGIGGITTFSGDAILKVRQGTRVNQFTNAVNVDNQTTVNFNGGKTALVANNRGYSSQAIQMFNNSTLNFSGKNVVIAAVSDYSATAIGFGTTGNTVNFENSSKVDFVSVIEGDGSSLSYANSIGYMGHGSTLDVKSTVGDLTMTALGSIYHSKEQGKAAARFKGDDVTIASKTFTANSIAGQDWAGTLDGQQVSSKFNKAYFTDTAKTNLYAETYGLNIFANSKVTVDERTQTTINVNDGFWNAIGVHVDSSEVALYGNTTVNVTGTKNDLGTTQFRDTTFAVRAVNNGKLTLGSAGTTVVVNVDGTSPQQVALYVDNTSTIYLNGDTTLKAQHALAGDGFVEVASKLDFGSSLVTQYTGQLTLKNGGALTLTDAANYFGGKVIVDGGNLDVTGMKMSDGTLAKTTLTSGALTATSGQIFTAASETGGTLASSADKLANHGLTFNGGTLTLNDARYTLDYSSSASGLVGGATQVVFTGTLVDTSKPNGEKNQIDLSQTEVQDTGTQNTVHSNATGDLTAEVNKHNLAVGELPVAGDTNTTVVKGNLGVKDLELNKQATKVDVNDGKRLTLVGATPTENLIKRDPSGEGTAQDLTLTVGSATDVGVLQLGAAGVTSGGVINDKVVVETEGNVTTMAGDFTLKDVEVKGTVNVQTDAKLTVETLKLTNGTVTTLGDLTVDLVDPAAANGVINVGNDDAKGALTVTQSLNGAVVFLDPVWTDGVGVEGASKLVHQGETVDGTVIVGRNSYAVFGANTDEGFLNALGQSGLTWGQQGVTAAFYADKALTVQKGLLVDGSLTTMPGTTPADGEVTFGANSLFVANVGGLAAGTAMLTGSGTLTVDATAKAVLVNVKKGEAYKLHSADSTNQWNKANVTSANGMFVLNKDSSTNGNYVFDLASASTVYGGLMQATKLADGAMSSTGADYDYANKVLSDVVGDKAAVGARFDAAMNPAGALGVYTTGYDRSAELRQSVREQVGTVTDSHLWVDVVGGRTEFDGLSTGAQSINLKTEHAGVVVGAETVVADTTVGAAVTAGKGSTRNNAVAGKDHFDYYGFTLYGQKDVNGFRVTADASVTALNSEVTVGGVVDENADVDTVVWSLGAEVAKTYAFGEMNLTPFVGADLYHLRADGYRTKHGADVASVNATAVEFPMGVRGGMTFDTKDGTKVKPGFSLAVVPTVGDREIDPTVTFAGASQSMNYTFADDVKVRSALTLDAVKDRFGLGIGLGYDWGNEERSGLNAQVKARFMF